MKKIDIVYVLGKGSLWRDNELRFSLRALQKNLKNFRKIWIVGEKPSWIQGINHIPFADELKNNADGNIARKVIRVCQEEDLTKEFLFINDDHLVMKSIDAAKIPPFHKGDLLTYDPSYFSADWWRTRVFRTREILAEKGYPCFHYDCHVPMVMNKELYPEALAKFDFEKNIGYTMKSLYGNVVIGDKGVLLTDEKVTFFKAHVRKDIDMKAEGRLIVSFNDKGLNPHMKMWLIDNFPDPSKYEKDQNDAFMEIIGWLKSPEKDYLEGYSLYEKHGSSRKAVKFLGKGETLSRRMKLEHMIRELLNYL